MENCLDVVSLDLRFKLIQRRSRDNSGWQSIPKDNCMREKLNLK